MPGLEEMDPAMNKQSLKNPTCFDLCHSEVLCPHGRGGAGEHLPKKQERGSFRGVAGQDLWWEQMGRATAPTQEQPAQLHGLHKVTARQGNGK